MKKRTPKKCPHCGARAKRKTLKAIRENKPIPQDALECKAWTDGLRSIGIYL